MRVSERKPPVTSAGSRRRRVGASSWKIVPTSSGRTEWSSGKAPESPPGKCERQRDSPGYLQLLGMERRARGAAAEPGRCQRRGSNDDLYPLLPVLLPTRDNTNHYHRLITGITANIEIMHAYACVCVCVHAYVCRCGGVCVCARAQARTHTSG